MNRKAHIFFLLPVLLISLLIAPACESNQGLIIPYAKVYYDLDLYAELGNMGIGSTLIIPNEGYRGIVLYREGDLLFHAYDLTCTEFPDHDEAVVENAPNVAPPLFWSTAPTPIQVQRSIPSRSIAPPYRGTSSSYPTRARNVCS